MRFVVVALLSVMVLQTHRANRVCVCVCVRVCERERQRQRHREKRQAQIREERNFVLKVEKYVISSGGRI